MVQNRNSRRRKDPFSCLKSFHWHVCCSVLHSWEGCRRWLPRCRLRCKGREMERGRSLICERKVKAEEAAALVPPYVWDAVILGNLHCRYLWWFDQRDGWWERWPPGYILLLATILFQSHRQPGSFFLFYNAFIVYSNSVIFTVLFPHVFVKPYQLLIWSCASLPWYEDNSVILIYHDLLLLFSFSYCFLVFLKKTTALPLAFYTWKSLDTHVGLGSVGATGRGGSGRTTVQKHPFMPLLRLSIVKRKRVCICLVHEVKRTTFLLKRPSQCSWACLRVTGSAKIFRCVLCSPVQWWDYILLFFPPWLYLCHSDCRQSSCRPDRWGVPLCWCWCNCSPPVKMSEIVAS